MLAPPHPIAAAAYAIAQRINPNAHALDGGPATTKLEIEVVDALKAMFGYDPATSLGHLTSSGTIANLEALWVARELHPDQSIAYSNLAHYTHSRMCQLLRVDGIGVDTDAEGRIDLDALEAVLKTGRIGTVVATAGSTGNGAVDRVDQIVPLAARYGARVHVDAAYGGYFVLLANGDALDPDVAAAYRAIREADSIVVDPHKRGLQPYGCGSVFFRDASVGRFYKHDSPYTYFTSAELHLGEISLECSRAGAAAAALWATMQALPLEADRGLGPILSADQSGGRPLGGPHPQFGIITSGSRSSAGHRHVLWIASRWRPARFHDQRADATGLRRADERPGRSGLSGDAESHASPALRRYRAGLGSAGSIGLPQRLDETGALRHGAAFA